MCVGAQQEGGPGVAPGGFQNARGPDSVADDSVALSIGRTEQEVVWCGSH